ncbi:MAG TPA: DUF4136 domain-containing protein [Caldithrix abyssi]|uniref:DUF4136 domain-containing protein n=1 Tax=Caldithrix abyssi TaxID=187145 RepID=A0A7V4WUP1_CALAY|nr:DUF4136 domain-containing protein [Caldithrix abyssi]
MKKIAVLVLVALFVFGCSSVTVVTDYDHGKDFTTFKTFAIYKGKTIPGDELAKHPLIKKRIADAVKAELENKGFKYVDDESASFVVVLHAGVREKTQITNWGSYGWYDPWWGPYGGGRIDVSQYDEATLVIDLVDAKDKELAWRGKVTKVIGSSTGQDPAELRHLVAEALKDFPPSGK